MNVISFHMQRLLRFRGEELHGWTNTHRTEIESSRSQFARHTGEEDVSDIVSHVLGDIRSVIVIVLLVLFLGAFFVAFYSNPTVSQNSTVSSAVSGVEVVSFSALDLIWAGLAIASAIGLVILLAKFWPKSNSNDEAV